MTRWIALALGLTLLLAGCTQTPPRLASQSESPAAAWLHDQPRTAGEIVARIVTVASDPAQSADVPVYISALAAECPAALPAVASALPALSATPVPGEGYAPADALAQVLLRCPVPTGPLATRLADQLLAYVSGPDPDFREPHLPGALARDVPANLLRQALPKLTPAGADLVAEAPYRPQAVQGLLLAGQSLPTASLLAGAAARVPAATLEAWLESPKLSSRAVRLRLLAAIRGTVGVQPPLPTWLRQAAAREHDPAVAEAMYSRLYLMDRDPAALAALNRLADRYGTFRTPDEHIWDWRVLLPAVQADPTGFLARGVDAYEAAEGGRPYFVVQRCKGGGYCRAFFYGDSQYDPAQEIPAWRAYLRRFAGHPAAADAAYRLARCEEITGDWSDALRDMRLAADVYPDGQIASEAQGRLDFMLDVEIPDPTLVRLAANPPAPALAAPIRYALAVRQLRAGHYAAASADLQAHPPAGPALYPWTLWPLAAYAARQRSEAAEIAQLAPAAFPAGYDPEPPSGAPGTGPRADFAAPPGIGDAQAAYRIAQILFHDDLALYNQLWEGDAQSFAAFDGVLNTEVDGDLRPQWLQQFLAANTYVEAEPIFAAIADDPAAPEALRARAAYSAGECLVHIDGYNEIDSQLIAGSELKAQIVHAFRAFAADFPHAGALVPDALLTVARYTGDPADVAAVTRAYPHTWQAKAAAAILQPSGVKPPLLGGALAFERLDASSLAPGSGNRAQAPGRDGWTAIDLAPAGLAPGEGVAVSMVTDTGPGSATVAWRVDKRSYQGRGAMPWTAPSPVERIRVPEALTHVTFQGPPKGSLP